MAKKIVETLEWVSVEDELPVKYELGEETKDWYPNEQIKYGIPVLIADGHTNPIPAMWYGWYEDESQTWEFAPLNDDMYFNSEDVKFWCYLPDAPHV